MLSRIGLFNRRGIIAALLGLALCALAGHRASAQPDPLPSWSDSAVKQSIIHFVARTTREGADFVPLDQRIAVFDNDGTLWSEQPIYFQVAFAIDRVVKALAPQHPEWKDTQPFKKVIENDDPRALAAPGEKELLEVMTATHAGMTTEAFAKTVSEWLASARHPRFNQPYDKLVYQPQLELLAYLRRNGFKTFIVSGGGVEFMRVFSERTYGIPRQIRSSARPAS
jgi:hypothetical protein